MTKKQIVRNQKTVETDIEKLFKIAVDELVHEWNNHCDHDLVRDLKNIVHKLRAKKQFSDAVYSRLESYFKANGKFYVENAGVLINDSSNEVFDLLSILEPETELKILRESWECFHDYGAALNRMVLNPRAVFDDAYEACTVGIMPNAQTIRVIKQLWNKEVAKANGQKPDNELQTKYAFIVRCMYCKASCAKSSVADKSLNKRLASELYRMNGFNRNLISQSEKSLYKRALQKSR